MNKEQIIEEMANDINKHCVDLSQTFCGMKNCTSCVSNALYNAGYRKEIQSEWKFWKLPSYSVSVTHELICSICGYRVEMLKGRHYNYCPNCGAKMRGE